MTDSDKGSFFYRSKKGGYKFYHKLLWDDPKYDNAQKFPGLYDKYGCVLSSRGSVQFQEYFNHKDAADVKKGISYLKELHKNFSTRLKKEKVGIQAWGGKQELYKIAADWKGDGQFTDCMEMRTVNMAPSVRHPAGKPQPVCGSEMAVSGLLRMEKVWIALRIQALEKGLPDFGSLIQQTYNGFRGAALGFNRANDGLRNKMVLSWTEAGYYMRRGQRRTSYIVSDHGSGNAFDIRCEPQYNKRIQNNSGWKMNWRRFLFFVALMQWERGGGQCKPLGRGAKMRNTFGRGDKPNAHMGIRNSVGNVSWKYGRCPTLPEMGGAGHLNITDVYKDGQPIAGKTMKSIKRPDVGKMDKWLPGWRQVCQKNNCWPWEWTRGGGVT